MCLFCKRRRATKAMLGDNIWFCPIKGKNVYDFETCKKIEIIDGIDLK